MPEYTLAHQNATGRDQIAMVLKDKVPPSVIAELGDLYGGASVGILEWLKAGDHISAPFKRAQQLAERTSIPQIVVFNESYFVIGPSGESSGPLASELKPIPDTAKNWAATASERSDTSLFAQANALLPERGKK